MCAYLFKECYYKYKRYKYYYFYGWKYAQDNCKSNLKFCFKIEKGKVFQRIINMVCSTYMHCFIQYKSDIVISEMR